MVVPADTPRPGDVLLGTYRVERVLGVGGMGTVVAARSLNRGDQVAIKVLLPDKAQESEWVGRFMLEARASVRIESSHVARVFDVGKLDNGSPYIVMEYLEGQTLAALCRKGRPIPIETAVEYVLQACEALAEAHAAGIVHRDLKPANLFLATAPDGSCSVKVLDFGVSKIREAGQSLGQTAPTEVLGSPYYMSPEQMRCSRDVDVRADIWALGVTLYELVTGKRPFVGDSLAALMMRVLTTQPTPLAILRPDAPRELEAVILKCLGKEPEDRYRDVAELAVALAPLATPEGRTSLDRISRFSRPAGDLEIDSEPPEPPRRRGLALGIGLTLLAGLLIAGAALLAR